MMKLLLLVERNQSDNGATPAFEVRRAAATVAADLAPIGAAFSVRAVSLKPFSKVNVAPRDATLRMADPAGAVIVELDERFLSLKLASRCRELTDGLDGIALDEHVHGAVSADGEMSGILRLGLIVRHPKLSPEEFRAHWLQAHAPLVMANEPLFDRYVANIPRRRCAWDGIVEQWFADEATWLEHDRRILRQRPEVRADIPAFVQSMSQYAGTPVFHSTAERKPD